MKYLQSLRSSDKFSLQLTDIGVITPYRKQVCTFISCLRLFPLVVDRKVKKRAGKLTRGVVVLFFLFVRSFVPFLLFPFCFAPRRSLREISKSCFRFKSYSIGSNPYYRRVHLMATSLQRPLIFVPADIPYIHCYFHPSSTATSPQRKRPLKLFPAAKNGKLFND